jgi:hypothetical protein
LSTSFGCKCRLAFWLYLSSFADMCANYDILVIQQNRLEWSIGFVKTKPRALYSMPLAF